MAIYEYMCEKGHLTSRMARISDPDEPKNEFECKECGAIALLKMSSTDFRLKGKWFKNSGRY